jgi:hypothetical protein
MVLGMINIMIPRRCTRALVCGGQAPTRGPMVVRSVGSVLRNGLSYVSSAVGQILCAQHTLIEKDCCSTHLEKYNICIASQSQMFLFYSFGSHALGHNSTVVSQSAPGAHGRDLS